MAIRAINSTGAATENIMLRGENIGDADAGYTTLTAAIAAAENDDILIFTENIELSGEHTIPPGSFGLRITVDDASWHGAESTAPHAYGTGARITNDSGHTLIYSNDGFSGTPGTGFPVLVERLQIRNESDSHHAIFYDGATAVMVMRQLTLHNHAGGWALLLPGANHYGILDHSFVEIGADAGGLAHSHQSGRLRVDNVTILKAHDDAGVGMSGSDAGPNLTATNCYVGDAAGVTSNPSFANYLDVSLRSETPQGRNGSDRTDAPGTETYDELDSDFMVSNTVGAYDVRFADAVTAWKLPGVSLVGITVRDNETPFTGDGTARSNLLDEQQDISGVKVDDYYMGAVTLFAGDTSDVQNFLEFQSVDGGHPAELIEAATPLWGYNGYPTPFLDPDSTVPINAQKAWIDFQPPVIPDEENPNWGEFQIKAPAIPLELPSLPSMRVLESDSVSTDSVNWTDTITIPLEANKTYFIPLELIWRITSASNNGISFRVVAPAGATGLWAAMIGRRLSQRTEAFARDLGDPVSFPSSPGAANEDHLATGYIRVVTDESGDLVIQHRREDSSGSAVVKARSHSTVYDIAEHGVTEHVLAGESDLFTSSNTVWETVHTIPITGEVGATKLLEGVMRFSSVNTNAGLNISVDGVDVEWTFAPQAMSHTGGDRVVFGITRQNNDGVEGGGVLSTSDDNGCQYRIFVRVTGANPSLTIRFRRGGSSASNVSVFRGSFVMEREIAGLQRLESVVTNNSDSTPSTVFEFAVPPGQTHRVGSCLIVASSGTSEGQGIGWSDTPDEFVALIQRLNGNTNLLSGYVMDDDELVVSSDGFTSTVRASRHSAMLTAGEVVVEAKLQIRAETGGANNVEAQVGSFAWNERVNLVLE